MQVTTGNQTVLGLINSWSELGSVLGVPTKNMAWALKEKRKLVSKIRIKDRTMYKSEGSLAFIQARLLIFLSSLFDSLPENEQAIAYRRGLHAVEKVKVLAGADMLVSFDIRHYFDSISLEHITEALTDAGLCRAGAKLIGRYCVVTRSGAQTLQQGSAASSAVSNIVGRYYIDLPVMKWLRDNCPAGVQYRYIRYCDNIAVAFSGPLPQGFTELFKSNVKAKLQDVRLKTHKWACIKNNHPKIHQKFIGVVLNREARIEKQEYDNLRALLFNACIDKMRAIERFMPGLPPSCDNLAIKMFNLKVRGKVQYAASMNPRHALRLFKLLDVCIKVNRCFALISNNNTIHNCIVALKTYKNDSITREEFNSFIDKTISFSN